MCSNPITFIQALAKTLNELLCTLNCHLIVAKHCHKSKWSTPSSTGLRNTTLVTFWKHRLKNAYCHPPPGPPVSTREINSGGDRCCSSLPLERGSPWVPTSNRVAGSWLATVEPTERSVQRTHSERGHKTWNPKQALSRSFPINK